MRVNAKVKPVVFVGEHAERLSMSRSNAGEPYRDGVDFTFETDVDFMSAFVEVRELKQMRDFLNEYLNDK